MRVGYGTAPVTSIPFIGDPDRKLNETVEPLIAVIRQKIHLPVSIYARAGMV